MIHSEKYQIRNYETDRLGKLTLLALANYLQHAADRHAIRLGVGMPALAEKGLSWVLHRMKINVMRWPGLGEEVVVETHPSGLEKVYVYRDFRIYDQDRNLIATASSTWLVFDTASRRLTTPATDFLAIFEPYRELPVLPRAGGRFAFSQEAMPFQQDVQARYNEIDTNNHVNNSIYFQWFLEPLSPDFLDQHSCHEIEIQFKKECRRDDRIVSYCQISDSSLIHHLLLNGEGKEVAVGETHWLGTSH